MTAQEQTALRRWAHELRERKQRRVAPELRGLYRASTGGQ
jgi:hypothetical protein